MARSKATLLHELWEERLKEWDVRNTRMRVSASVGKTVGVIIAHGRKTQRKLKHRSGKRTTWRNRVMMKLVRLQAEAQSAREAQHNK